jgi:hypothetical protein
VSKLSELSQKWIAIISSEAEESFMERNADRLVCFDTTGIVGVVESYFRLEGLPESVQNDFTPATICKAMEQAVVVLLRRGSLDSFVRVTPLPEIAQAQLDRMAGITKPPVDSATEAREAQTAAIAECARDYRSIEGGQFKRKWMDLPERRSIYDAAIAAGRIA